MTYQKTEWKDHLTPFPNRYRATENADGSLTLIEDFGVPAQVGTPISAKNMNKIEEGIAENSSEITNHIADKDNPHGTTKAQIGLGKVKDAEQATKTEFDAHANAANPHSGSASTTALNNHVNDNGAHGATSNATANRIIRRDGSGRASVATPTASGHIANKGYVDTETAHAEAAAINWVKSFGLGTNSIRVSADLNNEKENGWVAINNTTLNRPPNMSWGICRIEARNDNSVYQTAMRTDSSILQVQTRKSWGDGKWEDWEEEWHTGNLPDPARRGQVNDWIASQILAHNIALFGKTANGDNRTLARVNTNNHTAYGDVLLPMRLLGSESAPRYNNSEVWLNGNQGNPNNLNTSSKQVVGAINEVRNEAWANRNAPSSNQSDSGYQKFPTGLMMAYVKRETSNISEGSSQITFPAAFVRTPSITATIETQDTNPANNIFVSVSQASNTGCYVHFNVPSSVSLDGFTINVQAIGY